jgi:hypothetical protein
MRGGQNGKYTNMSLIFLSSSILWSVFFRHWISL